MLNMYAKGRGVSCVADLASHREYSRGRPSEMFARNILKREFYSTKLVAALAEALMYWGG